MRRTARDPKSANVPPGKPLAPGSDLLTNLGRVEQLRKQAEPHRQQNGDQRTRPIHSPVPILRSNPGSWVFLRHEALHGLRQPCCRFREASLLAVECSKVLFRQGAPALAPADGLFDGRGTFTAAGLPRKSGSRLPQSMFREASLLAVECSKVLYSQGASALAPADGLFDGRGTLTAAGLPRKSGSRLPQSMVSMSGSLDANSSL